MLLTQALQSEASQLLVDPTLYRTIERRLDSARARLAREGRREVENNGGLDRRTGVKNGASPAHRRGREDKPDAKEEAVKREGRETEEPLSKRQVEKAGRKAVASFDPSDVLKGVSPLSFFL